VSSPRNPLIRAAAWLESQNALSEQRLKDRPAWWHAAKVVFGTLCLIRAAGLAVHGTGLASAAFAFFFLAAGLVLASEGVTMLLHRGDTHDM
jgi:hypothetical protein